MKRVLQVFLGDRARSLGTLRYDEQGARASAAFEYDAAWLDAADGFAVDPVALPLVAGPQYHRRTGSVFHGAIADTEPDGWGRRVILRDLAKRKQRGAHATSVDFLLSVDDFSRVGAIRFKDESGTFQREPVPGRRTAPPLIELKRLVAASRAVEEQSETAEDLEYLRGRGTSLGGLRPKCSVIDDNGSLSIGKFPSVGDDRAVTKGEVLALKLAAAAQMDAAKAHLVSGGGVSVAVIKRFDRVEGGGRLMYISAATLLGVDANEPREHTYTELADAIRLHGADVATDLEELWRRVGFSIAINNVDDHLHNHGFLHVDAGKWRLSPAFDVNPFPDRARVLKTWISEDSGPEASYDALLATAPHFKIAKKRALEILGQIRKAVARWRTVGRSLGMTKRELEAFATAFEPAT